MAQSNDEQPASVQTPHFETTAVAAVNDVDEQENKEVYNSVVNQAEDECGKAV